MSLIVITGIDGCGKTTQSYLLSKYLSEKTLHNEVVKVYVGEYKSVLDKMLMHWSELSISLFFHALHVEKVQRALNILNQNHIAICDRWDETSEFYHTKYTLDAFESRFLKDLNQHIFSRVFPNVRILIDVDPIIADARMNIRGKSLFDIKPISYFEEMRQFLLDKAKNQKDHWKVVDGNMESVDVHLQITKIIGDMIKAN